VVKYFEFKEVWLFWKLWPKHNSYLFYISCIPNVSGWQRDSFAVPHTAICRRHNDWLRETKIFEVHHSL